MAEENLELDFSRKAPAVSADEIDGVCAFLGGKGWMRAREILVEIGIDDRRMRVIAEKSDGRIISGQKGYRLFDPSTPIGEADQAAGWLISQGKKMIRRGVAIRRRMHAFGRPR